MPQQATNFYNALQQFMVARREQSGLSEKTVIQVGSATCEKAAGSDIVMKEFQKLIRASGRDDIIIKQTGCTGHGRNNRIHTVERCQTNVTFRAETNLRAIRTTQTAR